MSKEVVISELLALPDEAQREIYALLQHRFAEENPQLSPEQMRELDQRLDTFEQRGSSGEKWDVVEARLLKARANAQPHP